MGGDKTVVKTPNEEKMESNKKLLIRSSVGSTRSRLRRAVHPDFRRKIKTRRRNCTEQKNKLGRLLPRNYVAICRSIVSNLHASAIFRQINYWHKLFFKITSVSRSQSESNESVRFQGHAKKGYHLQNIFLFIVSNSFSNITILCDVSKRPAHPQ